MREPQVSPFRLVWWITRVLLWAGLFVAVGYGIFIGCAFGISRYLAWQSARKQVIEEKEAAIKQRKTCAEWENAHPVGTAPSTSDLQQSLFAVPVGCTGSLETSYINAIATIKRQQADKECETKWGKGSAALTGDNGDSEGCYNEEKHGNTVTLVPSAALATRRAAAPKHVVAKYDVDLTTSEFSNLVCCHVKQGELLTLLSESVPSIEVRTADGKVGWAFGSGFEVQETPTSPSKQTTISKETCAKIAAQPDPFAQFGGTSTDNAICREAYPDLYK
jgi:hypothetical protein